MVELDEEDYDLSLSAVSSVPPEERQPESISPSGFPAPQPPEDDEPVEMTSKGPDKIDFVFDDEEDADETNSPGAVLSSGAPKEISAEPSTNVPAEQDPVADSEGAGSEGL